MIGQLLHKAAMQAFIDGNQAEARRLSALGGDHRANFAAVVRQARLDAEIAQASPIPALRQALHSRDSVG